MLMEVAGSAVVGACLGSFASVVAHRVPLNESIVQPGSRCPACGSAIRAIDNVPVLSFLLRRGHCRSCGARISPWYIALELLMAGLFVAIAYRVPSAWAVPPYWVLATALVALSLIDLEHMRIPTRVLKVTLLVGVPLLVLASGAGHDWGALVHAAVTGAVGFCAFLVVFIAVPKGFGFGDVRLAGVCGIFLGWLGFRIALVGFVAAMLAGGLTAILLLVSGRAGAKAKIAFGPFLAFGTLVAILAGAPLAHAWLA